MHATANEAALKRINVSLVVFSVAHSAISVLLVRTAGTSGLVAAGCLSMALRVAYCLAYNKRYFATKAKYSAASAVPSVVTFAVYLACAGAVHLSERVQVPNRQEAGAGAVLRHLLFGCLVGLALLAFLYRTEKGVLRSLANYREKRNKQG